MKKILFIIDSDSIGGVEKRFSYLFKYLASQKQIYYLINFLVNVKLKNKIDGYRSEIFNTNLKISFFGCNYSADSFLKKVFVRFVEFIDVTKIAVIAGRKYDVVYYATTKAVRYRIVFKSLIKVNAYYGSTNPEMIVVKPLFQKLITNGFYFDCLSEDIARIFLEYTNVQCNKVVITPNSFIDYSDTEVSYLSKNNTVLYAARFDTMKGIPLLLEVIKYVLEKTRKVNFIILGYGVLENEILSFIKYNQYSENVTVKFVQNPKSYMRQSKIFLSLQKNENYPSQSLLEAMACNNCIIATDVGLTYKLIDNAVGVLVPPVGETIGQAIIDLFSNEEDLKRKCMSARNRIKNTHTVENYYKYLIKNFIDTTY